jgi:hypothetical protein
MTESFPGALASTTPASYRRTAGILRILAGLAVLAAIGTQITDKVINNAFVPAEYFSYVTIQSSLMNIVVLLVGGIFALRYSRDTELLTAVRMSLVAYAIIVGVVYNVLLRDIVSVGYVSPITWPNEVIHVIIPVFLVIEWLLAPGRAALSFKRIGFAVAYPLLWVGFTLVRGPLTGWYPYPFLEPNGPGGWPSVWIYVVGIASFIIVMAAIAISVTRINNPRTAGRPRAAVVSAEDLAIATPTSNTD